MQKNQMNETKQATNFGDTGTGASQSDRSSSAQRCASASCGPSAVSVPPWPLAWGWLVCAVSVCGSKQGALECPVATRTGPLRL